MRRLFFIILLLMLPISSNIYANTPTESLKVSVDQLIIIATNKEADERSKRDSLTDIIRSAVDFEAVSRRVVSKPWKKATPEQKQEFKAKFLTIMVNTYFSLLKEYSNEDVLFLKEQLKKKKYAIVDTEIASGNKKIPVRYRMIKSNKDWKIYDFIPEGISLVSTYKKNYASILKKKGMDGLLNEMLKKEQKNEN
ncbi:MAG: ABC transporter substrate-binding protein [Gammaproteobacteria bacterium]|nr:ABC transporter substrate-binding protein [Gammaproteobacteria bacterium]